MNTLFPIYVKLEQIQVLLVGAGAVGLEKLNAILNNSPMANVHIVAESVCPEVLRLVNEYPTLRLSQRLFHRDDILAIDLVMVASNNAPLNTAIQHLCREHHVLLNVADKPSLCDFYLGSVVQKGDLKVGISTNGRSPTMAKRLKEFFDDLLPDEIDETLSLMAQMRDTLSGDFQEKIRILNAHTESVLKSRGQAQDSLDKR